MPQQLTKKFDTIIAQDDSSPVDGSIGSSAVVITIQPEITTPDCVHSYLNNTTHDVHYNNIRTQTGELTLLTKNRLTSNIDFEINKKGELIIHGEDVEKYSIIDGQLVFTE